MNKKHSQKRWAFALACLAFAVLLAPAAGRAMAYFTNYTVTQGSQQLGSFTTTTEVTEVVNDNKKTVSVKNTGSVACFVRVRALAGEQFTITPDEGTVGEWTKDGGWWVYQPVLEPGAATSELTFTITWDGKEVTGDFNVIVLEECVPARYDPDGTPRPDWDAKIEEVAVQ